jgi:hypothetical protein
VSVAINSHFLLGHVFYSIVSNSFNLSSVAMQRILKNLHGHASFYAHDGILNARGKRAFAHDCFVPNAVGPYDSGRPGDAAGDPQTQDALVNMLRVDIGKQNVLKELDIVADAEKQKLADTADNVRPCVLCLVPSAMIRRST